MLIVRVAGKEYPVPNRHDETVLGISASIKKAFDAAIREARAATDRQELSAAANRGDHKEVSRLTGRLKRYEMHLRTENAPDN